MRVKSISHFKKSLSDDLDRVVEDQVPLIVTRTGGRAPAIVIPADWYERWQSERTASKPAEET